MKAEPTSPDLQAACPEDRTSRAPQEPSSLAEADLGAFSKGLDYRAYEKLGAHLATAQGPGGARFAVWAPNALEVQVIGDFNGWDKSAHPLRPAGASGVWTGFVPEAAAGMHYKFHIRSRFRDYTIDKADPFAVRAETPPQTASVLWSLDYSWADAAWMKERGRANAPDAPIAIYEVHPGSWRRQPGPHGIHGLRQAGNRR